MYHGGKLDLPGNMKPWAAAGVQGLLSKQPLLTIPGTQDWIGRGIEKLFLPERVMVPLCTALEMTISTYLGIP